MFTTGGSLWWCVSSSFFPISCAKLRRVDNVQVDLSCVVYKLNFFPGQDPPIVYTIFLDLDPAILFSPDAKNNLVFLFLLITILIIGWFTYFFKLWRLIKLFSKKSKKKPEEKWRTRIRAWTSNNGSGSRKPKELVTGPEHWPSVKTSVVVLYQNVRK